MFENVIKDTKSEIERRSVVYYTKQNFNGLLLKNRFFKQVQPICAIG
jgi:hypothetical protein